MISIQELDESKSGQMVFEKVKLACMYIYLWQPNNVKSCNKLKRMILLLLSVLPNKISLNPKKHQIFGDAYRQTFYMTQECVFFSEKGT